MKIQENTGQPKKYRKYRKYRTRFGHCILAVLVNYRQCFTPTQAAKRRLPRRLKCSKTRNRTIKLVMADKFTNFQLMDIKNNHNLQLPTVFQ